MRKMNVLTALLAAVLLTAAPVSAQHDHAAADDADAGDAVSPYVDIVNREIATLSAEDVAELLAGSGWGFALPAELNGLPGPRHVLDMGEEIGLSEEQSDRTQAIFDAMQAHAVRLGQLFVDRERALDTYFSEIASTEKSADRRRMAALVDSAGAVRSRLRTVHLTAHLQMIDVLTHEQIAEYATGEAAADPCRHVPEDHDPDMWRRHNGCDG